MKKSTDAASKKKYDREALHFVVADEKPFKAAAGSGLENLCLELTNASYSPPHLSTLSRQLDDLRNTLHKKFLNTLKSKIKIYWPFITFDHCKGDNQSNNLVLSIHHIPELDWVLQSHCLSVLNLESLNANHTEAAPEEIIQNDLEKFSIELSKFFLLLQTQQTQLFNVLVFNGKAVWLTFCSFQQIQPWMLRKW